jgi:hypothetical protein
LQARLQAGACAAHAPFAAKAGSGIMKIFMKEKES